MYRTITASSQFKIYAAVALAALLMTLLAVTLTAGQAQAATTIIAPSGYDNSIPQQPGTTNPLHRKPAPEMKADRRRCTAARVVDSGHIALFDVWWNPEEGELTNNSSCPPDCGARSGGRTPVPPSRFQPGQAGNAGQGLTAPRPASTSRTSLRPSSTSPAAQRSTLNAVGHTLYTKSKYQAVWDADDEENPNGDGDRIVWTYCQACPPNGAPPAGGLVHQLLRCPAGPGVTGQRVQVSSIMVGPMSTRLISTSRTRGTCSCTTSLKPA